MRHRLRALFYYPLVLSVLGMSLIGLGFGLRQIIDQQLRENVPPRVTSGLTYQPSDNDIIRIAFAPNVDLPHLITRGGGLYAPVPDGGYWVRLLPGEYVSDLYIEQPSGLWAVTTNGLFQAPLNDLNPTWTQIEGVPASSSSSALPALSIEAMHGFTFVMGDFGVARGPKDWRILDMPEPNVRSSGLAMLADHSHVILNGESLALTHDMGLSWELIPTDGLPDTDIPQSIAADQNGHLLVVTESALYRWHASQHTWTRLADLPNNTPINRLQLFQDQLYALANGRLYVLNWGKWDEIDLGSIIGDGYHVTTVRNHRLSRLWFADGTRDHLWYSTDVSGWTPVEIRLEERVK